MTIILNGMALGRYSVIGDTVKIDLEDKGLTATLVIKVGGSVISSKVLDGDQLLFHTIPEAPIVLEQV